MHPEISSRYGNHVRVRASGICLTDQGILMVRHNLGNGDFWAPPGGGVDFGIPAEEVVKKEVLEETGLSVSVGKHLFTCEFIRPPLHAIELFFEIFTADHTPMAGTDPETRHQIILEARFLTDSEIRKIDPIHLHGLFKQVAGIFDIPGLKGYLKLS